MEIPKWAERALAHFRPMPAYRSDAPDPDRWAQWLAFESRFRTRWAELDSDRWRVPDDHPSYAWLRRGYMFPPNEYVRQCILECAIESAWELSAGQPPQKTIEAVKELDRLNDLISDAAGNLAALFRQRQTLKDTYSLNDTWQDYEENHPDAMRLFGAFELALTRPDFQRWASVAKPEIEALLNIAATQSRPVPTWAAVLDEVSYRSPRVVTSLDAGDIAVMGSKSNKSKWSPWVLRLIGRLDDWAGNGLPNGFFLECLTNDQLASLARVAFDADSDAPINGEQMRKAKERYRERKLDPDD